MSLTLPPTVSESALSAALRELERAVGAEHVLTSEEDMLEFRDPFWYSGWDDFEASAVVQPDSVEEIQAILKIANEHRVPLWVSGVGKNNGYGGSSPRVRGSIVVNLRRMNRVLHLDGELGYAVVEPGVRWFDLYDAIQAGGHKLRLSVADLGWGSVIGNTLDHGITYLPYGQDQTCSAGWRSSSRTARSCGPAAGRSRTARRPTSTSAASVRRRTSCSCSRTTASSRRWASG